MIGGEKNNFAKFVNRIILPLVQTTRAFRTSKVYLNKESEKFGTVIRHYDKNAVAVEIPAYNISLEQRKINNIHMHYQNITIIDRVCYIKVDVNDIANRYVDPRRAGKIAIAHNKIINKIEENISCGLNLIEREIINAEVLSHDLNLIHGIAKSLYKGFKHAKNDDKIQLTGKLKNNTFIVCICNNKVITEDTRIYKEEKTRKICMTPRGSLYECSIIQNGFSQQK